jgi:xanthine dehydrogenase small subunit
MKSKRRRYARARIASWRPDLGGRAAIPVYTDGTMAVRFVLNGQPVHVDQVDPHVSLLSWLRASGMTGTKEGCSEGECGACAVAVLRRDGRGLTRYDSINSCLVPLPVMDGQTIVTVEGVASPAGALHPVQQAMVDCGGSQCGYCTPGFVVSLFCEYYRPGRAQIDPESVAGNLCRCTGYRPILDAGRSLRAPDADDPRLAVLAGPAPELTFVDHAQVRRRFVRPQRLAQVFAQMQEDSEATLIGGGTDLMVLANQRYQRFGTLISLEAVTELRVFEVRPDAIVLGAGLALSEIEDRLALHPTLELPLFHDLLRLFSSRLIRNRATLGGNLGTASPIGDSLPALLALDAMVTLAGPGGQREVPVRDFFRGYRMTAMQANELVVSVRLPRPLPAFQRFYKVSKRVLDDISTVAAAFALDLDERGSSSARRVRRLRVAYGGIAATPLAATAVEELARGMPWNGDTVKLLSVELEKLGTPMSDHRGSATYRRAMTVSLLGKFFWESTTQASVTPS